MAWPPCTAGLGSSVPRSRARDRPPVQGPIESGLTHGGRPTPHAVASREIPGTRHETRRDRASALLHLSKAGCKEPCPGREGRASNLVGGTGEDPRGNRRPPPAPRLGVRWPLLCHEAETTGRVTAA